jgi:aminoglycoside phosphotransferase (APT) family kinase protein
MTISLSLPIAQGRTAEIYSWDDRHVLKLFRDWCPADWVDYEAGIARAVHEAGVPSPAVGEIIEVHGRRGLIYERLEGVSMLQELNTRPWRAFELARLLAELQVQINRQSIPGLPSYKDRLRHDIHSTAHLSEGLREKVFAALDLLPEAQNLCHGDYHPGNILITKRGPVVIDWMNACSGRHWADVARTSMTLTIGAKAAGAQIRPIVRVIVKLYYRTYLNRYLRIVPDTENEVDRWLPIIAAARLNEDIHPEREALLRMVQEGN